MGVIYGYISLTEKPVAPEILETMRTANSFWNPDGDGLWCDTHAGLGSLILFNTPEAIFEKQPLHFEDNRKVLVATARIDNRDELCRIFDIPLSARDLYPDSYYIRLAYEKWGEACPDHLLGDWCFAVWDKVNRKLFIARDHHGISALYYYKGPDFFVFSSSLKGILKLKQVEKKVNEYKIAQILVNWNEGGPQTCYMDIFRLPPAHTLSLEKGMVTTNRYWYLEHTPEIRLKNDQEYVDMFRELYTEAVRCRLRSYRPVGATLSGGLDSGSVCILAAQELAKYGKRLPAFTAVPLYDVPWPKNRIGDEGPLALALAEKLGNVDVTLCKAENISPLEGVEKMLEVHEQPGFAAGNAYWIIDILQNCSENGLGTLLIGQGGNATVSWPTLNYINTDFLKGTLQRYKQTIIFKTGFWKKDFLISNYLLNKYKIYDALKDIKFRRYFSLSLKARESRLQMVRPGSSNIGNLWYENGIFYGLDVRDPTIDLRLLKLLFGINEDFYFRNFRFLFTRNFSYFFDEERIKGKMRGSQSIDILERQAKNNYKFEFIESSLVKNISKKKHNLINKKEVVEIMKVLSVLKFNDIS